MRRPSARVVAIDATGCCRTPGRGVGIGDDAPVSWPIVRIKSIARLCPVVRPSRKNGVRSRPGKAEHRKRGRAAPSPSDFGHVRVAATTPWRRRKLPKATEEEKAARENRRSFPSYGLFLILGDYLAENKDKRIALDASVILPRRVNGFFRWPDRAKAALERSSPGCRRPRHLHPLGNGSGSRFGSSESRTWMVSSTEAVNGGRGTESFPRLGTPGQPDPVGGQSRAFGSHIRVHGDLRLTI